jgi:trk system potassium uptake protein
MHVFEGFTFLFCIPWALIYNEQIVPFIVPALISFGVGVFGFYILSKKRYDVLSNKENVLVLITTWISVVIIGTLPYLLSKSITSYNDILFETISGLTSTGSTILPNPEILPKSILFWRSLSQWFGGIVTIVMIIVIFPEINLGGYKIFVPERKKMYNIIQLVFRVFIVYCVLSIVQALLLFAGGINIFGSLCISFGTISTGCFLPDSTAIAGYSPYVQWVMAVFMLLAGMSVFVYYKLSGFKLPNFRKNDELKIFLTAVLLISFLFSGIIYFQLNHEPKSIARESIFQTVSFLSSSGYDITGYSNWSQYFQPLIYLLIVIGGCTGSASGGIKMSRFLIFMRNILTQFRNPEIELKVSRIRFNKRRVDEATNLNILTFIAIFGFVIVFGTLAMSFFTNDLRKSVFLTVSALSTFGNNIDLLNMPQLGKITLSLLMLMGRLEIFPILVLLIPSFYKNKESISAGIYSIKND